MDIEFQAIMSTIVCNDTHDLPSTLLSSALCVGLIISYLPQHIRIIRKKSSEGFSPWFLLLGATSATSGMLNVWLLQWPVVQCCSIVNGRSCFENTLGIAQVTLQWLLFCIVLVLYLIYFPRQLRYCKPQPLPDVAAGSATDETQPLLLSVAAAKSSGKAKTAEWKLALSLAGVTAAHLFLTGATAVVLLSQLAPGQRTIALYARFLGLCSTALAVCQYAPQLVATYRLKHVGALSIPTMLIQTPGSIMFVASLVGRPGVEWSSWLAYAATGVMQGGLLAMCLAWRQRQKTLGVDDFGQPLRKDPEEQQAA